MMSPNVCKCNRSDEWAKCFSDQSHYYAHNNMNKSATSKTRNTQCERLSYTYSFALKSAVTKTLRAAMSRCTIRSKHTRFVFGRMPKCAVMREQSKHRDKLTDSTE